MAVPLRTSGLSIVRIFQTAVWFLVRRIVIYLSLIFQVKKKKEANYPCSNPRNPLMKFYVERVETFNQGWISGRTRATPEELAKAGFFCLGEGDRTKCYYCNGELQNWKQSDDPWIEHAKWFPNCQYLLRIKGPHFVRRHFVPNLHLSHSTIERQVGQPTPANGGRTPSPTQDMTCSEEGRRRLSKAVEFVSFLGYPMEIIRRAIEERVRIVGEKYVQDVLGERVFAGECTNGYNIYNGTTDLLEDVVKTEQEEMERKKQEIERKKQDQRLDRPVCYGVTRDICADPPIEQTRHIPPGDHRKESYRLSTFKQFPSTCPVQKQRLVKAGFYFTGFKDRVKCFACGKTVEQWVEGDDPLDGKWHRSDCPMAGGQECGNAPLHSPETPIPNAHFPPIRKVHGTETNSIPAVEHPESEGETQMNFLCRPAPENGERASPHAVYVIVPKEARKRLKQAVQYISLLGFTTGEIKRALEENLKEVAEKLAQPELDEKRAFAEEACCILFNGVTDLEESVRKKKEKERRRKKQGVLNCTALLYLLTSR